MTYRIIQWGTGNVGSHALRTIIDRPDFELVGVRVYNPAKVGVDAGELIGRDPVGVLATDDVNALLALGADCVCFNPLGSTLSDHTPALDDICRILESGANVVSSAVEYHAYLRPQGVPKESIRSYERIRAACDSGQSSFFHVGINPGFCMDMWPLLISRVCRRIDKITATEIVDMSTYTSEQIVFDAIGFGRPPDRPSALDRMIGGDAFESGFYISLKMLADGLRVELDDARYEREVALADEPIEVAAGTLEPGTVAAMKLHLDGYLGDEVAIALEWVWRVTDEVAPEWPTGESRWLLHIDGDPTVDCELTLATTEDSGRATSLAVATLALNAVPTVCAAPPGPLDNLTIPTHGGGYFA